jgi:hypothetical protein
MIFQCGRQQSLQRACIANSLVRTVGFALKRSHRTDEASTHEGCKVAPKAAP